MYPCFSCAVPACAGDETDSKANATKSEASKAEGNATKAEPPVLPKMIKKTIQVTRKKTYHVSARRTPVGWVGLAAARMASCCFIKQTPGGVAWL